MLSESEPGPAIAFGAVRNPADVLVQYQFTAGRCLTPPGEGRRDGGGERDRGRGRERNRQREGERGRETDGERGREKRGDREGEKRKETEFRGTT